MSSSNSMSHNFRLIVEKNQAAQASPVANWNGTFLEYLDLIKKNPKITRNAYQRMFDMIIEAGTEEYIDFKKLRLCRYCRRRQKTYIG